MRVNSCIYIGDSREILPTLYEELREKIALVVTSPPYYVNRGYEDYLDSWLEFWEMLEEVFDKVYPLIEPWGKFVVNFADKYANAKEFKRPLEISYVPHYIRIMRQYDLWARIIWNKNRLPDGARHVTQKSRFEGQMRITPDWEHIYIWRKRGEGRPPKKQITMTKEDWRTWSKGIWNIDPVRKNPRIGNTKLAIFPAELPKRLIEAYTEPGDIVLDPFVGLGTTVRVARALERVGIGVERNIEMLGPLQLALQDDLFSSDSVQFINTYDH